MADNYLLVIAIDIGTTFSGYAFSTKSNKNDIIMNKNWGADVGAQAYKTPTTLLLNPDGSLKAFGYEAESEFADLDEDEIAEGYLLFQRFKMKLYRQKKLDVGIKIESTSGKEMSALEITTKALVYMKDHCLAAISKTLASPVAEEFIRWVITVPAIWNDTAKKFMRLAAHQAGLAKDMLSENLIIALEPEAASLYCRTLAMEKFKGMDSSKGNVSLKPKETYVIVDCGGGTIDVTVHKALENGNVEEVKAASGGPWGGTCVDRKYSELLDDIFGSNFMNHLKKDYPSTWLSMLFDFETKKRSANPETGNPLNLILSMHFAKAFEKHTGEDVESRIKNKKKLGVKYSNGMLRVLGETVSQLYESVIPQIRDHLGNLLKDEECKKAEKVFVVGGFGESAHIQKSLMREFGGDFQVMIPEEAGMCVLKGAVLFGHDTSVITSRRARFNYGLTGWVPYKPEKHNAEHVCIIKGRKCVPTFICLIRKGTLVKLDHEVEHAGKAHSDGKATIYLLCSEVDTDDPFHPSVVKLGEINIQCRDSDARIKTTLRFGGTDILLTAVDLQSGNIVQSTVTI